MVAKTDVSARKRQPKGVPIGGEFAHNEHDEAGALRESISSDDMVGTFITRKGKKIYPSIGMTPEDTFAHAKKSVSVYAARKELDPQLEEEVVQRMMVEFTETYFHKGKMVDGAVVNRVARLHVGKALGDHHGKPLVGSNGMAYTEFSRRVEEIEATGAVELTASEKDEIAADIIDNWHDQGHKPTRGFHTYYNRESSISEVPGSYDGDDYIHPALIDPYSPEVAVMESQNERAADILDSMQGAKGAKERNAIIREARANAWSIVAGHRDVPTVKAKLTDASRKTILSHVKNSGGAAAVAERYERGESDSATEALFMPFRERIESNGRVGWRKLSDAQMDAISDMIRSNPKMADQLWASALAAAK